MTFKPYFFNAIGLALIFSLATGFSNTNESDQKKTALTAKNLSAKLTKVERSEGWELLFDGKNTSKWRGVKEDSFPSSGWAIDSGALVLSGSGGDLITREKYSNFELKLDFKLTDSANSGIKYFVGEMTNRDDNEKTLFNGPEYQIIDDYKHPALHGEKGKYISTAALYLLYVPENKNLLPAGKWNEARIVAKESKVEHWLNGVKVLSYERGTEDFRQRVSTTKFANQKDYGELESGHILLTDHQDKVYFKNIKIRRF